MENRKAKQVLYRKVSTSGMVRIYGQCMVVNMMEICTHVNGKMRPVETIPVLEGGRIKENNEGGKFNYDIL
jgi:hypothetical protein